MSEIVGAFLTLLFHLLNDFFGKSFCSCKHLGTMVLGILFGFCQLRRLNNETSLCLLGMALKESRQV